MGWSPPAHAQGYAFAGPCILETIAMNPDAQVGIDPGKHNLHLLETVEMTQSLPERENPDPIAPTKSASGPSGSAA